MFRLPRLSTLPTPHPSYLGLSKSVASRLEKYRDLFAHELNEAVLNGICLRTLRDLILGTDVFLAQVAELLAVRLSIAQESDQRKIGSDLFYCGKKDLKR